MRVWNLTKGNELSRINYAAEEIVGLDSRRAISCSLDRTIRLWNLKTGAQLAIFTGDAAFTCCAVSPDGRLAGDGLGQIHVLEILL
jgi:WD40 repeat protein